MRTQQHMNMLSLIAAKGLRSFSKSSPAKTANRATDTSTSLTLEVQGQEPLLVSMSAGPPPPSMTSVNLN